VIVTVPSPIVAEGATTACADFPGVDLTASDTFESVPVPDVPFTVKLYSVPPVNPVIVQLSAEVTQLKLPAVTVYFTAATRVESDAVHVTVADPRPGTTDEMVGFEGVALSGVAAWEFSENAPDPLALAAETVTTYCEPLASPVTVFEVVLPLSVVTVRHVDPVQYFTE
jgi:hypothetical protein